MIFIYLFFYKTGSWFPCECSELVHRVLIVYPTLCTGVDYASCVCDLTSNKSLLRPFFIQSCTCCSVGTNAFQLQSKITCCAAQVMLSLTIG